MTAVNEKPILIHQIHQSLVMRQHADIQKWQYAMQAAQHPTHERRQPLIDVYQNTLLDTHLSGIIEKRKATILNTNISCGSKGEENEWMTSLINQPKGLRMLSDILHTLFYGHTLFELTCDKNDFTATLIPRRHVLPLRGCVMADVTNEATCIPYRTPAYADTLLEVHYEEALGLLAKVVPMVIYKRNGLGDFAQYAELFGQPIRKVSYDPQDPNSYDEALKRIGTTDGSSLVLILPKNTDIEFIESTSKDGSLNVYQSLIQIANAEMSKLILGNTLTTEQGDKGARSLGEVHQDAEEQLILRDRIFLLNVLNYQLKPFLIKAGLPIRADEWFYFKEVEELDLQKRIAIDSQLNTLIPIPADYFYHTYNIPKPQGGEAVADRTLTLSGDTLTHQTTTTPPPDEDNNHATGDTDSHTTEDTDRPDAKDQAMKRFFNRLFTPFKRRDDTDNRDTEDADKPDAEDQAIRRLLHGLFIPFRRPF